MPNAEDFMPGFTWGTSSDADEQFVETLQREMAYRHWSEEQKRIFELCLKWFYETHEVRE